MRTGSESAFAAWTAAAKTLENTGFRLRQIDVVDIHTGAPAIFRDATPITPPSRVDMSADICEACMGGAPGRKWTVRELCEATGGSAPQVRKALNELLSRGRIDARGMTKARVYWHAVDDS